ncbi:hypothetical protein MK805_11970 [Shimazuella sp. AN120528]|uniref:hypothetical protein n=1 Tax=Shimazuella soli TaxID=1892854 RepID=UPI001F0D05A8|nr:hypothetical protein [Shimazuella soli]MCH5585661.1 hypothetical protein [Shimazuella soli]
MKKGDIVAIIIGIIVLVFLFWFLFLRDDTPKKEEPPVQTPSVNTNTQSDNSDSSQGDDSSPNSGFSDKDINVLSKFVTDFTTKFISYDKSKPNEHLDSVKDMMTPQLYALQKKLNANSPDIKNISVKQVSIADITPGQMTSVNLYVDVTITTIQNQTITTTYAEKYLLTNNSAKWKVVSVGDAETNQ